jgi:hypothetical protein
VKHRVLWRSRRHWCNTRPWFNPRHTRAQDRRRQRPAGGAEHHQHSGSLHAKPKLATRRLINTAPPSSLAAGI